jgi:hypothetical protein
VHSTIFQRDFNVGIESQQLEQLVLTNVEFVACEARLQLSLASALRHRCGFLLRKRAHADLRELDLVAANQVDGELHVLACL